MENKANPISVMNDARMDALQEICNIGIGNAATSLAQLIDRKISIRVPRAVLIGIEEIFHAMGGGPEEVVSCALVNIDGDIGGTVLFIFSEQSTYRLVEMLLGQDDGTVVELDEMGESVVSEIGNVLTSSFMSAISGLTGMNMHVTVPMFAFDMFGAILSTSLVASGHWDDQMLFIETELTQENNHINGEFFLLPETGALNKLFASLGL